MIGGEALQYWNDRAINSADWDLVYSWTSFRQKLTGQAYSFDTNRFETNFAYHPIAGTLYYLAPRNNRLPVLESLGFAFTTSTLWEIVVEFRERVSINDMWVTPLSGLSLGETTTQLGAFFDRGCPTGVNRALGFVFGPLQTLHDKIDGVTPLRARYCDQLGFDARSEHRFNVSVGFAELRANSAELYRVARAKLETSIVNLPATARQAAGWRTFADGNLSDMTVAVAYGQHEVADLLLETRATLAGAEFHGPAGDSKRPGPGDRAIFGVVVGAQYSLHRYELGRPADRVFLVDAPAITVRFSGRRPQYRFALALDAGLALGAMDALALGAHRAVAGNTGLTTITEQQGYNYVAGIALVPMARLELQGVELGVKARGERVTAIRVWDRNSSDSSKSAVPDHELRRRGELWISLGPRVGPRFTLTLEAAERSGTLGASQRRLSELGLGLNLGAAL